MQILPVQTSSYKFNAQDASAQFQGGSSGFQFADLLSKRYDVLQQALASSGLPFEMRQDMPVVSSASQQTTASHQSSTAETVKTAMDASRLDAMRDVKMTQEDFAELRPGLEKAGLSKESMDAIQQQIVSPQGLTWGQFVGNLHESVASQVMGKSDVSDTDKQSLVSFFNRLGFNQQQSTELANSLANGKTGRVWKDVQAKLSGMSLDEGFTVPSDEIEALAKALKLSPEAGQRLSGVFGAMQNNTLTAKGLSEALHQIKGEVAQQFKQVEDVMTGLRDVVGEVISRSADRHGLSRQVMESQVESKRLDASLQHEPAKGAPSGHDQASGKQPGQQDNAAAGQPGAQNNKHDPLGLGGQNANQGKNSSWQDQQKSQDKSWGDFWGKVRTEGDVAQSGQSGAAGRTGLGNAFGVQSGVATPGKAGEAATERTTSQSFVEQVEAAVLKNLGQGGRQLSFELSPENLGKLNIVLTVKGKEVQALIKTESPEASKLVAENLAQVKESLEKQGLTVSKLEVRTGLSQDSTLGQQWSGAEQHNQAQERRDALGRMRSSALAGGGLDVADLAQDMQNRGVSVKNAQGGLDVMA